MIQSSASADTVVLSIRSIQHCHSVLQSCCSSQRRQHHPEMTEVLLLLQKTELYFAVNAHSVHSTKCCTDWSMSVLHHLNAGDHTHRCSPEVMTWNFRWSDHYLRPQMPYGANRRRYKLYSESTSATWISTEPWFLPTAIFGR